jgi:hypothetical protein
MYTAPTPQAERAKCREQSAESRVIFCSREREEGEGRREKRPCGFSNGLADEVAGRFDFRAGLFLCDWAARAAVIYKVGTGEVSSLLYL